MEDARKMAEDLEKLTICVNIKAGENARYSDPFPPRRSPLRKAQKNRTGQEDPAGRTIRSFGNFECRSTASPGHRKTECKVLVTNDMPWEEVLKRVMPHSLSGQSVIGSMLFDPDAIEVASEMLREEDFYSTERGPFDFITEMYQKDLDGP